jgi:hypothetical protein
MAIRNLQNFLQSLGQRVGTGFERMGATTDPRLSPEAQRLAGIQNLSQALRRTGATLSGDPQRMALQAQEDERLRQRRLDEQRKRELMAFAQQDPSLAKMYEVFGEQGLRQEVLRQRSMQDELISNQKQIERLRGAGFDDKEINLVLAGVTPKDVMEMRGDDASGEQIIQKVEENVEKTTEQTGILDTFSNIDEAFGPVDATQELLSKGTRAVFGVDFDPLPGQDPTGAAVRARDSLNTEILANLAADFTGRPNMLIYENLKNNLPMTSFTSEEDAKNKYENVRNQVETRIESLKEGLRSSILSDADKNAYREELDKSITLTKKLDSAILALTKKKTETLEPEEFADVGGLGQYEYLYESK